MVAPAEVRIKRSNFRIRQFKEKHNFNIAANLMFNTMVSFIIRLIARTARIACADRQTHIHTYIHTYMHTYIHTHIQDNYCNPRCLCAPRVNKCLLYHINCIVVNYKYILMAIAPIVRFLHWFSSDTCL